MHYTRAIKSQIQNSFAISDDIVLIYGARQVGKTILCQELLSEYTKSNSGRSKYFQCEDVLVQQAFAQNSLEKILELIGGYDLVVLDEAQTIADIGWRLKLIADHNDRSDQKIKVIATGSSSFELANRINEPLTGRMKQYWLFPLSLSELTQKYSLAEVKFKLPQILTYGLYPSVFDQDRETIAKEMRKIFSNYLYKDILNFENLKKPTLLKDLTKLLALQIGQKVSLNSLAQKLNTSIATTQRYLDLLEQTFIIFKLRSLNRNSSKEVSRHFKVYFYDLGMRNYVLNNFNPLNMRMDVGPLWENFCTIERVKKNQYEKYLELGLNQYFWRTYDGAEIDYIEEKGGQFRAVEFKYNDKKRPKAPIEFSRNYPNHTFEIINQENFEKFLVSKTTG